MNVEFNITGYNLDWYFEGKFVGSTKAEKDRQTFGYSGREKRILEADLILKKKTYKKGTEMVTELIPICGRII